MKIKLDKADRERRRKQKVLVVWNQVANLGLYSMEAFDPSYEQKKGVSQVVIWEKSVSSSESCSVLSNSLWPHGLYSLWNSPGKNTGVGSLTLLQGIFPTQASNPGLLHCRILYQLSHQGSPRILEWVAYPFSSGSSRPRNRTGVSCIADGFFTNWAIRKTHIVV